MWQFTCWPPVTILTLKCRLNNKRYGIIFGPMS